MFFYTLANAIGYAVQIIVLVIIIRAVLSFFPNMDRDHPVVRTLDQIVEPIVMPIRKILPPMGGLDFSPMVAILALQIIGGVIETFLRSMAHA